MPLKKFQYPFLLFALIILHSSNIAACSMCKITKSGKTMVGNNEDAWGFNARIWFEVAGENKYGAAYLGHTKNMPEGGINQAGLVYDGFTLYPKELKKVEGKKGFSDLPVFLKSIMQNCGTVAEVKSFAEQFDRSRINSAMLLFVDRNGDYLVIEADTLIIGKEENYILSNFRPEEIREPKDVKIARYHRGMKYLEETEQDSSYQFCAAVMEQMKECRGDLGDGTLYTSVYDLNEKLIYLYFYHDFENMVALNLEDELAKGNHTLLIPALFPENEEYAKFLNYKTPFSSKPMFWWMIGTCLFFFGASFFFFIRFLQRFFKEKFQLFQKRWIYLVSILSITNLLSLVILLILMVIQPIFYFGFEGSLGGFPFTEVEYFPIIILLFTIIMAGINFSSFKPKEFIPFGNSIFTFNIILLVLIIGQFIYWDILIPK